MMPLVAGDSRPMSTPIRHRPTDERLRAKEQGNKQDESCATDGDTQLHEHVFAELPLNAC